MATEIEGVAPGARIKAGQLFRATWFLNYAGIFLPPELEIRIFEHLYQLLEESGLVSPVSAFEAVHGDKAMVVDLRTLPTSVGMPISDLARWLHRLRNSLSLERLELIEPSLASDPESRRGEVVIATSDQSVRFPNPIDALSRYGTMAKWLVILAIVLVAGYLGLRAVEAVRGSR